MDSIEFVNRYNHYLSEIRDVIKPDLCPQLDEFAQIVPHDLVTPERWSPTANAARGYVWSLFVKRA